MSNNKNNSLKILLIVVALILLFFLFIGNIPKWKWLFKSDKVKEEYDEIDFEKLNKNYEKYISERKEKLKYFENKRKELDSRINKIINRSRIAIVGLIVVINILIYVLYVFCKIPYTIEVFVLWNQAFLISVLVFLFMLSERYTSLKLAFEELRKQIVKRLEGKWSTHWKIENRLNFEIEILEYIENVHPSYLKEIARIKKLPIIKDE